MKKHFIAKRCAQVFGIAFLTLSLVYTLRGRPLIQAVKEAALWSLISATFFAGTAVYYRKTKKECNLCVEDTREPPMN